VCIIIIDMHTSNLSGKRSYLAQHTAIIYTLTLLIIFSSQTLAAERDINPVEVGDVRWTRDYPAALAAGRASGKPLFLLFQEVPGCIGCKTFGQDVLTHPLLVEAIEEEFIPVLVFNNKITGMDAELLKRFGEPSWNYQVVRFINGDQKDIIPRRDKVWDLAGVASRMLQTLQVLGIPVPRYLKAVALENDTDNLETVVFATACFWTGERMLGKIDGVVQTEAGWYDGREVTLVRYHKNIIDLAGLVEQAAVLKCAQSVYVETEPADLSLPAKRFESDRYRIASQSDQKRQIQLWLRAHQSLTLSLMQITKLNATMPDKPEEGLSWLSPRQLRMIGK
jgi:hypothetical protein